MLNETAQEYVYRWVTVCELLYGQPKTYYEEQVRRGNVEALDLCGYYVLISGLDRAVYRQIFGMDAFNYTDYFRKTEAEIRDLLARQNVTCITAMMLYDHTKRFVMIFSPPAEVSAQDVAQIVSSCFNRLYAQIFDMSKTPHRNYTVLSRRICGFEHLHETFVELDELSRQKFFDMRTMTMTPALLEESRTLPDIEQIHEDLMQMYAVMRAGDEAEMLVRYDALADRLQKARDFRLLKDVLSAIHTSLKGMLRSHGVEEETDQRDAFLVSAYPTFAQLKQGVRGRLLACMHQLNDTKPMSALIQEAVRYIRHHYAEDISVSDVAMHIGMSESWLTKRFRQECGQSVVGFLLDVRVEKAKELLAQTEMLILEIACAVGFENSGYFISVFRRVVGMTPKAYRTQMRGEA